MKNRFNLNEEEKNRIKKLQGIRIIKEQGGITDSVGTIKEQVGYTPECGGIEKDPKTNSRIWYPCLAAMMYNFPNAPNSDEVKEIYAQSYRNNVINGDWDMKGWIDEYLNGEWRDSWDKCVDCVDGDGNKPSDYECEGCPERYDAMPGPGKKPPSAKISECIEKGCTGVVH